MSVRPFVSFTPGWSPVGLEAMRANVKARFGYASVRADVPIPPAWFIPSLRTMEQGQAGTCWLHAATAVTEDFAKANNFAAFPICRRMVGYAGQRFSGGGNPSNGGFPTYALIGMSDDSQKGMGIAHESLLEYSDDYWKLAAKPPPNVIADAQPSRLTKPVDVSDDDDSRRLISQNHPVANGIWWTPYWDTRGKTFFKEIGRGSYGHALEECGYAMPGVIDDDAWFCLRNWHGQLYEPLAPEIAAKIPNYRPDNPGTTSTFWVDTKTYARVRSFGNAERVSMTDLSGFGHLFNVADALAM